VRDEHHLVPSCVQMNATWYKGGGNRRPQNEDEICDQPQGWEKLTFPQRPIGRPWYPMPIGYQDIFENAGFPSFFKNFGVQRSTPVERNLVLGLGRFAPGLGKTCILLPGGPLGSHSHASAPPRYPPDPLRLRWALGGLARGPSFIFAVSFNFSGAGKRAQFYRSHHA
jgi:hypothetical protein